MLLYKRIPVIAWLPEFEILTSTRIILKDFRNKYVGTRGAGLTKVSLT